MEVVVVAPPRPDLGEPGAVRARLAAQRTLDRRVDKDALHAGLARHGLEQAPMLRRPGRLIDILAVGRDDIGRRHLVALGGAEPAARHRRQPDIGVEPDLVRAVPGQHRPAARLGDVADQEPGPAGLRRQLLRQPLEQGDQEGVAPGAIARRAHDLPVRSVGGQRDAALQAAPLVGADRLRRSRRRRRLASEHALGCVRRQMGENGRTMRRLLGGGVLRRQHRHSQPRAPEARRRIAPHASFRRPLVRPKFAIFA